MNQKQPSSGDRTKPRTLLKFVIPTAGLILAFCSMLSFTTCSARHPSLFPWKPSIAELDRKAKPHFDQAKKEIPQIARNLSTVSSVTRLCWYMATDKAALEKYLTEQLQPMIRPCANGAAVYGVNMNTTVFHALTADVGKDNMRSTVYAVAGLGMEAVFAKTLIRSLGRVLGAISARMAVSWGSAAGLAVADGPLPIGDIIGVVMGVGGTAWSAYDLWQCRVRLPLEITAALNAAVDNVREECRKRAR